MSINEKDRLDLRQAFEQLFEDKRIADIAMNALPPIDYTQLATKQDLALITAELRADMAELKGELRTDMGEFKGEVSAALAQNLKVMVLTVMSATVILAGLITTVLA